MIYSHRHHRSNSIHHETHRIIYICLFWIFFSHSLHTYIIFSFSLVEDSTSYKTWSVVKLGKITNLFMDRSHLYTTVLSTLFIHKIIKKSWNDFCSVSNEFCRHWKSCQATKNSKTNPFGIWDREKWLWISFSHVIFSFSFFFGIQSSFIVVVASNSFIALNEIGIATLMMRSNGMQWISQSKRQ